MCADHCFLFYPSDRKGGLGRNLISLSASNYTYPEITAKTVEPILRECRRGTSGGAKVAFEQSQFQALPLHSLIVSGCGFIRQDLLNRGVPTPRIASPMHFEPTASVYPCINVVRLVSEHTIQSFHSLFIRQGARAEIKPCNIPREKKASRVKLAGALHIAHSVRPATLP